MNILGNFINNNDPYFDFTKINFLDVDFEDLKRINASTIGWIKLEGTNINYPFVQAIDNSFYLKHSFYNKYNPSGWVFLDYRNNINLNDKNTIIYAHAMKNNTMFGSLKNTLTNSWFNNKNNHIVRISTDHQNSVWQVFSVYTIPTNNDYLKIDFNNDFNDFTNKLIDRSIFNFNTNLNENDNILTLSTCYDKKSKIALHAKLIKVQYK